MKILVVGGGGREHAMAWKVAQSPQVERVFVAPGNAGTEAENKTENIAIGAEDIQALLNFVNTERVDLTIVGPEVPLVAGIVDRFAESGLRCFGPSRAAAQLEGSKTFCKAFLTHHGIPTAQFETFTDSEQACDYVRRKGVPIVVKADGLAAGKGVVIAQTEDQACQSIRDMLSGNTFGDAGCRVVVEELLYGEEASFIVIADGDTAIPMATSQDHKPRDNGDAGPNTGGMGAYSPAPVVTPEINQRIMDEVIAPTLAGMRQEGIPYTGFLYAGLMIAADGSPKVLEYNCRFGDPETQPIMMRLKSDLVDLCLSALDHSLKDKQILWDSRPALGVVLASDGYPGSYATGETINGLNDDLSTDTKVFHAGTKTVAGRATTAGGRVLCACALGDSVTQAQQRAYELAGRIHWDSVFYRSDIGYKAVARENHALGVDRRN